MAQTIETFIDRLQTDGVEAGREAAEKIRADAEAQAKQIVAEAEKKAKQIAEEARAEAEKTRQLAETELRLAARDAVLGLQESLERSLKTVLVDGVRGKLEQTDFLGQLLLEIVMRYVQADIDGETTVEINVSEPMRHNLTEWALKNFHDKAAKAKAHIDLHGSLAGAGFEYSVTDGTVEVTVDSVAETLAELVGPELRKMVAGAAAQGEPAQAAKR